MWKTTTRTIILVVGLVLGGAAAISLTGLASDEGQDADPRRLPYAGQLSYDGEPFDGEVDLRFNLSDGDDGNAWSEAHTDVAVTGGNFGVTLGAVAGEVPDWLFDAEAVYLSIDVRRDDAPWAAFQGRQRLHPAAFAHWAAESDDLRTDGTMMVAGDFQVRGTTARFDSLVVEQGFAVPGELRLKSGSTGGLTFAPGLAENATASVRLTEDQGSRWLEFHVGGDDAQIVFESGASAIVADATAIVFTGGATVPDDASMAIDGTLDAANVDWPIRITGNRNVGNDNGTDMCLENPRTCWRPSTCVVAKGDITLSNANDTGACRVQMLDRNGCLDNRIDSFSSGSACSGYCLD